MLANWSCLFVPFILIITNMYMAVFIQVLSHWIFKGFSEITRTVVIVSVLQRTEPRLREIQQLVQTTVASEAVRERGAWQMAPPDTWRKRVIVFPGASFLLLSGVL